METKVSLTFKIYKGDELVREETLTQGTIKIGKIESADLRIDDETIAPTHAVIDVRGPSDIRIMDFSGTDTGIVVNGAKINQGAIKDGDELVVGQTRIVLGIAAEQSEVAVASVAPAAVQVPVTSPAKVQAPMGVAVTPPAMAPQRPRFLGDPSIDVQDGSRSIEVTAMFENTVVQVRHLTNPAAGKVSNVTWAILLIGIATILGGFIYMAVRDVGFGAVIFMVGAALGIYSLVRRQGERISPHYTLGPSSDADLHLSNSAIPAACFPLVQSSGTDYSLLFTPQMQGDVTVGQERIDLSSLLSSGRARLAGNFANTYQFPISQDSRIKVDIGSSTFLINSVIPARKIVSPFLAALDGAFQMSNGVSAVGHLLILFLVYAIPPDAKSLSLDLFNSDNKLLKVLIRPPEEKEEDIPDWLKKKSLDDEAGGKGKKHAGEEGKMGDKKSKKKLGLYGLKGPENNPDPHLAKRLAEDAAKNAGVLGLLKSASGSHIASIFGRDSALGTDAEDALGGLIGNTIGEAYGAGGLGLVGTGRGGGGTGEGTIGLGALGTIGKGGGGGYGAGYGRGQGRLSGRYAKAPTIVAGTAQVRGSLDKEIIRRIIRRHINEVRHCYSKELMSKPDLQGRVMIQFTIAPTGQVVVSNVQQSTLGSIAVESCIANAVRRWLFPKPKGGGIVIVSYPFVLRRPGD